MKWIDSKGRLFGKISVIDLGAALVIVMVMIGIFIFPGTSGSSVAQVGEKKPVEMDILVQGLSVSNPQTLKENLDSKSTTNLIIRNQPHGQVEIKSVELIPQTIYVPQPDGSVKVQQDPRPVAKYQTDLFLTLAGEARETDDGFVLGGNKLKIGTTVKLEGFSYKFPASLMGIRSQ